MARYYNTTRGVVTVSLRTGESAAVAPKQELVVTVAQDKSASLTAMVRKGYLVLRPERVVVVSTPVPPVVPPVQVAVAVPVEDADPTQIEAPSLKWTKAQLLAYAERFGLTFESNQLTKAEILDMIEAAKA